MPTPLADRRAALDILTRVIDKARPLDEATDTAFAARPLTPQDKAFARALATVALRRRGGLGAVVARLLDRPLPARGRRTDHLLHLGLAQLFFLDVPDHAAVDSTVSLVKDGYRGLANAVLRRAARDRAALEALLAQPGVDLPPWLWARWRAAYGEATAAAIALALRDEPPLDLTPRQDAARLAEAVGGERLPTGSVRLTRAGDPSRLPGFADGGFWVQDAAAALPARLLGDVRGKAVADLCAAPGGKTLQLAAAGARVTAVDRSAKRLDRLKHSLRRTGLTADIVAADLTRWQPGSRFDAILLDAPCSATGTLRRHPDVAWHRRDADISKLCAVQEDLLDRALGWLAPDGELVFATCSLEPEEGPEMVERLLGTRSDIARRPITGAEIGEAAFVTAAGDLRTLPSQWPRHGGLDGFYAARLVKVG